MSILRQLLLDTICEQEYPQTVGMICRILHIDDVQSVQTCCHQLTSDGLLDKDPDYVCRSVYRYRISKQGRNFIHFQPTLPARKTSGKCKFYQTLENKHARHFAVVDKVVQYLTQVSGMCTISRLCARYESISVREVQSAIYFLLTRDHIIQCGPLLIDMTQVLSSI
jgi:hypothetical protein